LRTHTEAATPQARTTEVEDYRRRARDLQRLIKDTNQFMADATQELREKETYETQQLLLAIRQVIRELGEGQGYSLILADGATTAGVLAFTPALDLTPQVIQRVDQRSTGRPGATAGGAPPLAKKH
jgi:Skp family chaperone for outer membrane proteins